MAHNPLQILLRANVCFASRTDMRSALGDVRFVPIVDINDTPSAALLTGRISHRYRPECSNCGLGSVTLFIDLQVGWRDVGKDAAQRVQPTRLTGCKAAHRPSLATVIKTITECTTTNN